MLRFRRNLSYANVMGTIAVFMALGGGAYAAIKLPANSVGAKQIKKKAVTLSKIDPRAQTALRGKKGPTGTTGPTGGTGPTGPTGNTGPTGTYVPPATSSLVLDPGSATQTAYTGNGWVLEALTVTTMQLRSTTSGDLKDYELTYPQSCGTQPVPMGSSFRFSATTGDTLGGSLCAVGSTLTAHVTHTVGATPHMTTVVCQRRTSNELVCTREP